MSKDPTQHLLLTSGKDEPYNEAAMYQMARASYGVSYNAVMNNVLYRLIKELVIQNICVLIGMAVIDIIFGFEPKLMNYIMWPIASLAFSPTVYFLMRAQADKAWKAGGTYRMALDFAIMNARIKQIPEPQFSKEQLQQIQLDVATFIAASEINATHAELKDAIARGQAMSRDKADPRCEKCGQRLGDVNQPCPICKEPHSAANKSVPISPGHGSEPQGDEPADLGNSATTSTDSGTS